MFCCHVEVEEGTSSEKMKLPILPCRQMKFKIDLNPLYLDLSCFHGLSQVIREVRNASVFHELLLHFY